MSDNSFRPGGIGLLGMMFIVLFTLKLTSRTDLSWVAVTAPLWAPALVALVVFVIAVLASLFGGRDR